MPMANPKACQGNGPHSTPNGIAESGELCNACRSASKTRHNQLSAGRRKRYGYEYEAKYVPALKAYGNVLCQFVDSFTRRRCTEMADITHHLLDADAYKQFLTNHKNTVRVCRAHHPNSPGDPGNILYVPTIWPEMLGGAPRVDIGPGEIVPAEIQLWTLATQRKILFGR